MMRRYVGLAPVMAMIAVLALGLAAMKVATVETARLCSTLFLVALLFGTLGMIVRRHRAPWIGFALFGWAYEASAIVPPIRSAIEDNLPTNRMANEWVIERIHPPISTPIKPLPFDWRKENGVYYRASLGGFAIMESFQPTPDEVAAIDAYLSAKDLSERRNNQIWTCLSTFYSFAGFAFALLGAAAGKALSSRPANARTSAGAELSPPAG